MSFNFLDSVKGLFTPDLISTATSALGESNDSIQKALGSGIPAVLAGLISKGSNAEGASGVLHLASEAAGSGILSDLGSFFGNEGNTLLGKGAAMLKDLLGDKAGGIASLVSNFAGIKHSSASSVLSMVAPTALGALGKYARESNLNASGLMGFLSSQKNNVMNALPAGFAAVAGLPGLASAAEHHVPAAVKQANGHAAHYAAEMERPEKKGLSVFLTPLIIGILAVALCIYIFKGCSGQPKENAAVMEQTTDSTHMGTPVTEGREILKVILPNDTVINAYKGGIEDKLVAFLKTDYKKLGEDSLKKIWFDFDNLNFKTGSADITEESHAQVQNLAAILKAFPMASLKIGGYTDKVGDEKTNKKLSGERAEAVRLEMNKAGVGKQVTGAEGYGSAFAVYEAGAPETDRVKDRHVSVSVR